MNQIRLIAEGLSSSRGGYVVFSGISFALESGASIVVTGANGSGKSTLLKVVAGLLPATTGSVNLEGGEGGVASHCHYLGHENAMKTVLTVAENLAFWQRFLGAARLSVDDALDSVGLGAIGGLPYGYLSAGQRRRAAIARLLVSHRPVWLLDEPTAGLDAASEAMLTDLLGAHLGDGGIVVAASHSPLGLEGGAELSLGDARLSPTPRDH